MINKKIIIEEEFSKKSIDNLAIEELPINTWVIQGDYKFLKPLNDYNSISYDLDFVTECLKGLQLIRLKEMQVTLTILFIKGLYL